MAISDFDRVVAAAQEGSEWAWDVLIREVGPALVRFFRGRGIPDPEALTGEVLVDLGRGIAGFDGDESGFRSWVFVIAYRRMYDEWRRLRRRPDETPRGLVTEPHQVAPSAEDEALQALGSSEVARILEVLTDDQRDVITLRVVVGLTLQETAAATDKPVGAVKALQRRAVAALRREIERQGVSR